MNKYCLFGLLMCLFSFSSVAGFNNSEGQLKSVYLVNHKTHRLVIDDVEYTMPISFKVYKYDTISSRLRTVNRYAIRKGQKVYINTYVRDRRAYVGELMIFQE